MSDPLKNLKAEIHKHDFTHDLKGEHAKFILGELLGIIVYTYNRLQCLLDLFDKTLSSTEEQLEDRAPPLDIVIYALKSIIYPKFLPHLMSDFLRLFSMVEFYRIRVNKKVDDALVWNTYYKEHPTPGVPPLKEDDEAFFQHIVDNNEHMRKMFMRVVVTCCFIVSQVLWV